MAWIYLAESEDSPLPYVHGSTRLPTVNVTDTLKGYSCPECKVWNCPWLLFGMMSGRCPAQSCRLKSTSSMGDFRVRTLAPRVAAAVWQASEADFTSNSSALSEKQNQLSCSLKTSLQSGHADLDVWCGDFPSSGMIVDGQLSLPKKLVPLTFAKDGSYLPTPNARDWKDSATQGNRKSPNLGAHVHLWPTPRTKGLDGGANSRKAAKARGMWPTPHANCGNGPGQSSNKEGARPICKRKLVGG
jgi:hypothetical protein